MTAPDIASLPAKWLVFTPTHHVAYVMASEKEAIEECEGAHRAGYTWKKYVEAALASPAGEGGLPYVLVDPNAEISGTTGYRPVWIADAEGKNLFLVGQRGDPSLARFVVQAMNNEARRLATPEQPEYFPDGSDSPIRDEARGVEECPHCVNGIVPMTMDRPCKHCHGMINATPNPVRAEQPEVQGAWKLVPVEPTEAMLDSLGRAVNASWNRAEWYAHLLAAAPAAPAVGVDDGSVQYARTVGYAWLDERDRRVLAALRQEESK